MIPFPVTQVGADGTLRDVKTGEHVQPQMY